MTKNYYVLALILAQAEAALACILKKRMKLKAVLVQSSTLELNLDGKWE